MQEALLAKLKYQLTAPVAACHCMCRERWEGKSSEEKLPPILPVFSYSCTWTGLTGPELTGLTRTSSDSNEASRGSAASSVSQPVFHLGDDFILRADILLMVGKMTSGRLKSLSSELTLQRGEQTLRGDQLVLKDCAPIPGMTALPGDRYFTS